MSLSILTGVSCEDLTPVKKEEFSSEGSTVTLSYRYSKKAAGQDLQHVLEWFAAECEAAGMRISTSKSEAMVLDRKRVACPLRVGGEILPQVEEFKYLGILFTSEGKMECEIDRRIGAASAVMREDPGHTARLTWERLGVPPEELEEVSGTLSWQRLRKVTILAESSSGEDDKDEPPAKTPRLFTGYRKKSNKKDDHVSSVKAELIRYIQVSSDEEEADCLGNTLEDGITANSAEVFSSEGCSVTLSCTYSVKVQNLQWYRQDPGSAPQFLLLITDAKEPSVVKAKPPHPRLTAKLNEERNQVYLQISSAAVTDSAVYYCAVRPTVTGNSKTLYKNLWSKDNRILHNIH
ncbi:hypothetical protein L3Q82_005946 [Scortum barcoo]|uniref:Uncharacterized protein n=1 Tax=Scortum barcoo TaxID=214431 RepID=A0ACB8X2H7_9TELE|nr:hypothetical protein L3Q82_005946 [Scortum barcoo]